jgi:predicted HicB family RNase H-like nuclease
MDGLESNFRAAVNEYLAFCAEEGKIPDQPFAFKF